MDIVFVDEGESNRAILALSLYDYMCTKRKNAKLPKAKVATVGKNKSLHMKALKSLKEFGLNITPCSRKDVNEIEDVKASDKTKYIVLGQENKNDRLKAVVKKKNVECWVIDNPIRECKSEVKLRFFRRVRDQLWVKIEELVKEFE